MIDAVGGHVSRNLLADNRGHVYVTRLRSNPKANENNAEDRHLASLVECDALLQEIAETPLRHYHMENVIKSHGITGLVELADGTLIFSTHVGYLYKITPHDGGPATVRELGWFHPDGTTYAPSLFTFNGERYLAGVTLLQPRNPQWTVFDLQSERSTAFPFDAKTIKQQPFDRLQIFGSLTRDNQGRFYVVGRQHLRAARRRLFW